jgi:lipopolysaccharide transport system ATP-binding protein
MSDAKDRKPILRLRGVGVAYKRRVGLFRREPYWALRDISFDLHHGESLGVIGRNGAGKSTLLKLLAGIIEPDKGQVERSNLRADLLSLKIGFSPYLTGRENAIVSGLLIGARREEVEACMPDIIAFSELAEVIDQPLRTYSSGMRARLGFAVAFTLDPDIILIDEVLGVGDADFREKSTGLMKERIRSDKTVVIVSHSASVIRELCSRTVWIQNGATRAEGPTELVLDAYQQHLRKPAKDRRPGKATQSDAA